MFGFLRKKYFVVRDKLGNVTYSANTNYLDCNYFEMYETISVLNTVINIGADYLSKFKFGVKGSDGTIDYDDPSLELLNNPNPYQSKEDFLRQLYVFMSVGGYNYTLPVGTIASKADYLYNLVPYEIDHNYNSKPYILRKKQDIRLNSQSYFTYTDGDVQNKYEYRDVVPFFSTINGVNPDNNPYVSISKVKALVKELSNIKSALDGENRGLNDIGKKAIFAKEKSNSSGIEGMNNTKPLDKTEKEDAKRAFNNSNDKTLLPNKALDKLDLSVNLKNIGINESFSRNQGIVAQAFGLSNDLYNYLAKGATYENKDKDEVRFIQNYIQPIADNIANSFTNDKRIGDPSKPFVMTIDHAPTMADVEKKKSERAKSIAETMKVLIDSGYSKEEAFSFINDNLGINLNKE